MEDQLLAIFREIEDLKLPGSVAAYGYRMDASVQDCYLAVVFTSREAYFAHAEHPEVVAIDRRLMTLLERDPCAGYVRHVTHDEIADAVG